LENDTFLIETCDGSIVASPKGITASGNYFDTARGKTYKVDGTVIDEECPKQVSSLAGGLAKMLTDKYVKRRFPRGLAGVFEGTEGSNSISFIIYADVEDMKNNRYPISLI
jgi:hypothetical protein